VVETAQLVRAGLEGLGMKPIVKTTGSRGLHVYVAIVRGPTQKQVWSFAKRFAFEIAALRPDVVTAEYRIAKRPVGRVLVDYNQNAWGRTLASAYSPRPRPLATVSAPLTWQELEAGARIEDFVVADMPARITRVGDLWAPLLAKTGRFDLATLLQP
jgi:bifunctional non-homologous end joining protein LigD